MSDLVDLICRNMEALVQKTKATFLSIKDVGAGRFSDKERKRYLRWREDSFKDLAGIERVISQNRSSQDFGFNWETIDLLSDAYGLLDQMVPDTAVTEKLGKEFDHAFVRSPHQQMYDRIFTSLPISISATVGIAAFSFGIHEYLAATGLTLSAVLQYTAWKEKSFLSIIGSYAANLASIIDARQSFDEKNHLSLLYLGYQLVVMSPLMYSYLFYEHERVRVGKNKVSLGKLGVDFDKYLRFGTVLEVARENLGYVHRVCTTEKRPVDDFLPQIDVLEEVLGAYLVGRASYADVKEKKISYVPQAIAKKEKRVLPLVEFIKKRRYTPEEYARLRASKELEKSEEDTVAQCIPPLTHVPVSHEERDLSIAFSQQLLEAYGGEEEEIAGYDAKLILDAVESKLRGTYQHELLRKHKHEGKFLHQTMRERHSLDAHQPLFKLRVRGSLRALYTRKGDTYTVLEVLPHEAYDDLLARRT